jgi:predicted nucleic acid-binding protein
MAIVIADAGPLHYLILIDEIEILPHLFQNIVIPETVRRELCNPLTPEKARLWAENPPAWIRVEPDREAQIPTVPALDAGERAALMLALALEAGLVLMDDRAGVAAARALGFEATGTLGIPGRAADRGLIDLSAAVVRLRATNFWCSPRLLDALLTRHAGHSSRPPSG